MRRLLVPALAAASLLAAAAPSPARAPTAQEKGSLDWLLRSLQEDREEDAKGPKLSPVEAMIELYRKGESPFEAGWSELAEVVKDGREKFAVRDKAVTGLLDRFRLEAANKTDPRVVGRVRNDLLKHLLRMIMDPTVESRRFYQRLLEVLYPNNGVEWKPEDSALKRSKAYKELEKRLR